MGTDYYSMLVLGTMAKISDLFTLETIVTPNCQCPNPALIDKYCPDCGKTGVTKKHTTKGKVVECQNHLYWNNAVGEKVNGEFHIFPPSCGLDMVNEYNDCLYENEVYIGKSIGHSFCSSGYGRVDDKAIDPHTLEILASEYKPRLKQFLEPHGLWDENKFKLYSYLFISY